MSDPETYTASTLADHETRLRRLEDIYLSDRDAARPSTPSERVHPASERRLSRVVRPALAFRLFEVCASAAADAARRRMHRLGQEPVGGHA